MVYKLSQKNDINKSARSKGGYNKFYSVFDKEFSKLIRHSIEQFWLKDFNIKLISLENDPGLFWHGHDYFVSQANLYEDANCFIRLSENTCSMFFELSLGSSHIPNFVLDSITDLEVELLSGFNNRVFDQIRLKFIPQKEIRKIANRENSFEEMVHLGFMVCRDDTEGMEPGKIIISIPRNIIDLKEMEDVPEPLDLLLFDDAPINVDLLIGHSKVSLEEIKNIEIDDVILLDRSNIYKMTVLSEYKFEVRMNPDPKLVSKISLDEEGDDEEVNQELISEANIWDNIQIDIGAEFKKIKFTLGELRQMSEGLVIDVASVYDNEITLSVENKVVAKGELIIIGDKYGVRLTQVIQNNKSTQAVAEEEPAEEEFVENIQEEEESVASENNEEDDEDFDLSDFEIEDDDI